MDLIGFIVNPPDQLRMLPDGDNFRLFGALLLDFIWRKRNLILYGSFSLGDSKSMADDVKLLEKIFEKFENSFLLDKQIPNSDKPNVAICWKAPPSSVNKLNLYAPFFENSSCIAIVARDSSYMLLGLWSRIVLFQ